MASDFIGSIILGLAIFHAYVARQNYDSAQLWAGLYAFSAGWVVAASTQALYSKRTLVADLRTHAIRAMTSCGLAFSAVLLLAFALRFTGEISRVWLLTWAAGAFFWVLWLRLMWARYLRRVFRRGGCLERVVVVSGSPREAHRIGEELARQSGGRLHIVSATGFPAGGAEAPLDWIEEAIRDGLVDRVVITGIDHAVEQTQQLVEQLACVDVDVTFVPTLGGVQAPMLHVGSIGMLPAIDLSVRPLSPVQAVLKRAEDLVFAGLAFLMAAPVFVLIGIAIKLDSRGPVFFFQPREGYNGRTFRMWKFRSMYHNMRDEGSIQQTGRYDRRVTRVGRVLRRLSIDELPQIINVLRGEMSIVGPRPHALGMTSVGLPMHQVIEEYAARHRLKPGITGLAQVSGCRGQVDSHEKLRRRVTLDCEYISRWSLSLDLWIIARTAALLLFDSDAY
jgi:Undecaprenyl-phosphate glucose phosphotransferase